MIDLADVRVGQLHVEGQHEADRALADIGRPVVDVGVADQRLCSKRSICALVSAIEAFCGRCQSTISSGRSDDGKNCCCNEAHAVERRREQQQPWRRWSPSASAWQRPAGRANSRASRPGLAMMLLHRRRAGWSRRAAARTAPRRSMRSAATTAMTTNSVKVYSPAALSFSADRNEARDRHQRAGQHREGGRGVDIGRGLAQRVADLEPRHHHLDRDHGVVDQEAERDDQRAERNALQRDAEIAASPRR